MQQVTQEDLFAERTLTVEHIEALSANVNVAPGYVTGLEFPWTSKVPPRSLSEEDLMSGRLWL